MSAQAPIGSSGTPRIIVEHSPELPLVSITVALRSGASLDPEGREGLARFTARLMRRTGGGLSPQVLDTRIDSLGGALGADISHSSVSFHGTVIARSLDAFVDLMVDILARPGFAHDEHERLARETESDLVELRDNDRALARRAFRRHLFDGHPYGRSVSGTLGSVKRFEAGDLKALYRRTLCANNLVFAFAGSIDHQQAQRVAERIASALPAGEAVVDGVPEPKPVQGRRLVFVDKPERTQTQIYIGGLGSHPSDSDHTALHVANTVFGGTFTARMTQEIRSKRGWSYGAYSALPYDRHRRAFSMWTFPKAEDAPGCIALQLDMLKRWREKGITKKELGWAKRYLVRSHAFAVDTSTKRVGLSLESELYGLPPGFHEHYVDRVQAVTLDEANHAVQSRISDENLLVALVGTHSAIGEQVQGAIGELADSRVVPFDSDL